MKITETAGLTRFEWIELIDSWIFNEKHRAILKRRLLDEIKLEQLSEEFNMSVDGIKKIVRKNVAVLKRHI